MIGRARRIKRVMPDAVLIWWEVGLKSNLKRCTDVWGCPVKLGAK